MDIARMKELIAQREAIDAELTAIVTGGEMKTRKALSCSICHQEGHTARTCPQRHSQQT